MAHYEKFSKQGLGHIFLHLRRGYTIDKNGNKIYVNFGNKEIDTSKSHLNYNLNLNENGHPANQAKQFERIMQGKTLPEGYLLTVNGRKDLKVLCSWVVSLPDDVLPQDEDNFFKAVYDYLKDKYPHCVSAFVHKDESVKGKHHLHYAFVPVFYDVKKDIYKISANELVNRNVLKTFHNDLSKAVEVALGYTTSIMTGECSLRREQGLRGSVDILKYKAQKLAEEYAALKDKFNDSGLKLSADMADYIVSSGQKEQFAQYQREKDMIDEYKEKER